MPYILTDRPQLGFSIQPPSWVTNTVDAAASVAQQSQQILRQIQQATNPQQPSSPGAATVTLETGPPPWLIPVAVGAIALLFLMPKRRRS